MRGRNGLLAGILCLSLLCGARAADKSPPGETDQAQATPGAPAQGELRTWSDKSGKFSVRARFVELNAGELTLETADGGQMTIALDKLSDANRQTAERLAKEAEENPFKLRSRSNDKSGDKSKNNPFRAQGARGDAQAPRTLPVSEADWSQTEELDVDAPNSWSLPADAAPAIPKPLVTKPIVLQSRAKSAGKSNGMISIFDKVDGLLFFGGQGQAALAMIDKDPRAATTVRIQKVDLAQGKLHEPLTVPAAVKPVDIDPTGRFLLTRSEFHVDPRGPRSEVSVWEFQDKALRHVRTWNAAALDDKHAQSPSMARFVDADHVLTTSFPNTLVLWEVATSRAVYRMSLASGALFPALSANGKYLAAAVNGGVFIFEALSGKTLARPAGDPGAILALSFEPAGRRLAGLSHNRLIVWELERGDVYREICFTSQVAARSVDWVADGYVLINGTRLVDLERRIVLWNYDRPGAGLLERDYGALGDAFWFVLTSADRKERALYRATLPHDDARKAAAKLDADELLAFKPGSKLRLQVDVQGTAGERQQVADALSSQLQRLQMTVVDAAPLVLQATTETGKTQEVTYRPFGLGRILGGGAVQTASVTPQISRLRLTEEGKVLWEGVSSTGDGPMVLRLKKGETAQDALARYQQPNLGYFSQVKLPSHIARQPAEGAYGASQLTPQGIKQVPLPVPKPPAQGTKGRVAVR